MDGGIKEILELMDISGKIHTKTEQDSFFICYFDLFDRIMDRTNSNIELVIVENMKFNTQMIIVSDKLYMIISYENIKSFDLHLNLLLFPEGHNSYENPFGFPENIFESLWNYKYINENGEEIFRKEIEVKSDFASIYQSQNAINIMSIDSNNLLNYLKSFKNYSMGFEIFITFMITHELVHTKSDDKQSMIDSVIESVYSLESFLGSRADWIERHLFDLKSLFNNESTLNEIASDISALSLLGEMYIKNGLIDKRIFPIYIVVLFNNLFLFYLLNNRVDSENIKEILFRKSLCLVFLKTNYRLHENRLYYKLLCHIDSYLIEVAMKIAENKFKDDPEYNVVIVKLITRMKYIHEDYIPKDFDINQTSDINLLKKWIDETAKELNNNEK